MTGTGTGAKRNTKKAICLIVDPASSTPGENGGLKVPTVQTETGV